MDERLFQARRFQMSAPRNVLRRSEDELGRQRREAERL